VATTRQLAGSAVRGPAWSTSLNTDLRPARHRLLRTRLACFFFSSRRRHTRSVSAFLLNRSSDLYTVKDCVTIDVLPRTPGNNVYVGFMVWSNFTATKCRGLVSLNQVIKEIICLQPLK